MVEYNVDCVANGDDDDDDDDMYVEGVMDLIDIIDDESIDEELSFTDRYLFIVLVDFVDDVVD